MYIFILREPRRKTTAAEKGKIIIYRVKSVISKHFPDLFDRFNYLTDSRMRKEYSMAEIVAGALYMFLFKETSRNAYNNDRRDDSFSKNYYRMFKLRLPSPDAIEDVLRVLPTNELEMLKAHLVSHLIEQKVLRKFRYLDNYYFVAVDATGTHSFEKRHCEHCLTKISMNGVVTYFHYVLEAKLVTLSGFAISLASEFIENIVDIGFQKQDCEQKAFVRLSEKIKKHFPRLPICILADGLYPNNTVFSICRKNGWKFIITLKDGNLKTFREEARLLKNTAISRSVCRVDKTTRTQLEYLYLNDIEYDKHTYSWVSCIETKTNLPDKREAVQQFVYITNIWQALDNVVNTADSGRLRWKIENEGFNTQKNQGYELEHKYSRVSYTALQNYYQLLQIAHMINQFTERTTAFVELLNEHSKQTIKALWKDMIVFMKSIPHDMAQLLSFTSG